MQRLNSFTHHYLQPKLLCEPLAGIAHTDTVRTVLVNDRNLDIARLGSELRFSVFTNEFRERLAVLVGMYLRAEDVLQVLVLEHRRRDRGRDPENPLLRFDLGGERHCVRARIDAVDDVDLLLAY